LYFPPKRLFHVRRLGVLTVEPGGHKVDMSNIYGEVLCEARALMQGSKQPIPAQLCVGPMVAAAAEGVKAAAGQHMSLAEGVLGLNKSANTSISLMEGRATAAGKHRHTACYYCRIGPSPHPLLSSAACKLQVKSKPQQLQVMAYNCPSQTAAHT
jgi:hypothetical protein